MYCCKSGVIIRIHFRMLRYLFRRTSAGRSRLQGIGSPGIRRGTWNRRKPRGLTVSWHARRGRKRGILWKTLS